MSLFDNTEKVVHGTATAVFGDTALWRYAPPGGTPAGYTAAVLVNEPTDNGGLGDANGDQYYMPVRPTIEWHGIEGFPGIFEAVRAGHSNQITVTNSQAVTSVNYFIESIERVADGDTYIATVVRI